MGLTAIVKPTRDCNLACKYCYIDSNAERGKMDYQTMKETMEQVALHSKDNSAYFIWHGGEPLLMGLDFFKEVNTVVKQLREKGYSIKNGIQSNATLVDENFLDFVEKNQDFYPGYSLDGPEEINNRTRVFPSGKGAFSEIIKGVDLTRERNLGGGIITVLSRGNIRDIFSVYDFFKQKGIDIKINPIINQRGEWGISSKEYAETLLDLFNVWIDDPDSIDIDPFTQIMGNLMSRQPIGCNYSESCRKGFISIGPQGDIYPCGRFDGTPELLMGNINNGGLAKALNSPIQKNLSQRTPENIQGCTKCEHKEICNSGCMHNAHVSGDIMKKDPYCGSHQRLFKDIGAFLHQELTKIEKPRKND